MKKAELVSGLVLLTFGIALWIYLIPWQIAVSPGATISPRMMPRICAAAIMLFSLMLIGQSWLALRRDGGGAPVFSRAELLAAVAVVALIGLASGLFVLFGPLPAGLAVIVLPMLALGERRILMITLLPAGLLAGAWLLFYVLLGTSFQ